MLKQKGFVLAFMLKYSHMHFNHIERGSGQSHENGRATQSQKEVFIARFYPSEVVKADQGYQTIVSMLQERVHLVAQAAPVEQLDPARKAPQRFLDQTKREVELFTNKTAKTEISEDVSGEGDVIAPAPEFFLDLIKMGHAEMVRDRKKQVDESIIDREAKKSLGHELDHVLASLEYPQLEIEFGIGFFRDPEHLRLHMQTFVEFCGDVTIDQYRTIMGAPENPSPTDKKAVE